MDDVYVIDQRAAVCYLDQKSAIRFYFSVFFDLMDLDFVTSYIVYNMMHPNDLTLPNFKTIPSTYFIARYISLSRAPPVGKTDSKRKYQYQFE